MIEQTDIEETYQLLARLIQNKCINPPGTELVNIRTIEEYLKNKGISCELFESSPTRGNLIARIKGIENGPSLMLGPSHVDVVPVPNPQDWSVDPFGGIIKEGFIWGRGAIDMLFIVASQVQAFSLLVKENFQPKGDIILFIVADEEAGGTYGVEFMMKNHPDLIKVDYCVSESGGVALADGKLLVMIGEKGGAWKKIIFKGTPGHGSMPFGSNNAVVKAAKAIQRIEHYCNKKIPLYTEFVNYLAEGMGMSPVIQFMLKKKRLIPLILKLLKNKNPETAKVIHSLTRMTMSPNIVSGGIKANIIAAEAAVTVDIRTLPGQDDEYVDKHLKKALGDLAYEAEIVPLKEEDGGISSFGNSSPIDSPLMDKMKKAMGMEVNCTGIVPLIMPGVTDMRYFRKLGTHAFGFSLMDPYMSTADFSNLPHGTDERVSLKTVELSLKAFYNLAKLM